MKCRHGHCLVRLDSLEAYKHTLGELLLFRALLVISVTLKNIQMNTFDLTGTPEGILIGIVIDS